MRESQDYWNGYTKGWKEALENLQKKPFKTKVEFLLDEKNG